MSGTDSGHGKSEPQLVEDPKTGERYLLYALPVSAWPAAPRIVYECPVCHGRFLPTEWASGCPGCAKAKDKEKEKPKDEKREECRCEGRCRCGRKHKRRRC